MAQAAQAVVDKAAKILSEQQQVLQIQVAAVVAQASLLGLVPTADRV